MLSIIHIVDRASRELITRFFFRLKKVDCRTAFGNINGVVLVAGRGKITIGAGTRLNSGIRRNPIGGDSRLALVCRSGGTITLGENCGLSNCAIVAQTSVQLEDYVMIGGGVKIYDTDFHNVDPAERRTELHGEMPRAKTQAVLIKRNAFIGAHSIVLKGVTIGENSVIGAGSVVTKSVPDNEVWAGNPAHFLRDI